MQFIGKNAKLLATLLVIVVTANVGFQFYTHKNTALSPWKGGGFGMYTDPHADSRTVWLEMRSGGELAQIRLYPENAIIVNWQDGISLKGGQFLQNITDKAAKLRYYPTTKDADELITLASRIAWLDDLTGGVQPKVGNAFLPYDTRIVIFENAQDMYAKKVTRRIVFETQMGGQ